MAEKTPATATESLREWLEDILRACGPSVSADLANEVRLAAEELRTTAEDLRFANAALHRREERFRRLAEASVFGFAVGDLDGAITYANLGPSAHARLFPEGGRGRGGLVCGVSSLAPHAAAGLRSSHVAILRT
jgi:PAS domain-containing protein